MWTLRFYLLSVSIVQAYYRHLCGITESLEAVCAIVPLNQDLQQAQFHLIYNLTSFRRVFGTRSFEPMVNIVVSGKKLYGLTNQSTLFYAEDIANPRWKLAGKNRKLPFRYLRFQGNQLCIVTKEERPRSYCANTERQPRSLYLLSTHAPVFRQIDQHFSLGANASSGDYACHCSSCHCSGESSFKEAVIDSETAIGITNSNQVFFSERPSAITTQLKGIKLQHIAFDQQVPRFLKPSGDWKYSTNFQNEGSTGHNVRSKVLEPKRGFISGYAFMKKNYTIYMQVSLPLAVETQQWLLDFGGHSSCYFSDNTLRIRYANGRIEKRISMSWENPVEIIVTCARAGSYTLSINGNLVYEGETPDFYDQTSLFVGTSTKETEAFQGIIHHVMIWDSTLNHYQIKKIARFPIKVSAIAPAPMLKLIRIPTSSNKLWVVVALLAIAVITWKWRQHASGKTKKKAEPKEFEDKYDHSTPSNNNVSVCVVPVISTIESKGLHTDGLNLGETPQYQEGDRYTA